MLRPVMVLSIVARRGPFVSHAARTELVIEHIEKYWAPTTTSGALTTAFKKNAVLLPSKTP